MDNSKMENGNMDNNYKILDIKEVKKGIFSISFYAPQIAEVAKAGQFVFVKVEGQNAPILRRAFGIYRASATSGSIDILFKVLGPGTEMLSQKNKGDTVNILGPLGTGFDIKKGKTHFIVAGGMGVAPIAFLASKIQETKEESFIFLGAKTEAELLCHEEMSCTCGNVFVTTDDGSVGDKCFVNVPLEQKIKNIKNAIIYACGPHAMLKTIALLGQKYNIEVQVSLEGKMGCALGVCQGCPVEVKNKDTKYKMVCKDGPVFNAGDIVW